jgi:DNA-binding NtrC family response regulator
MRSGLEFWAVIGEIDMHSHCVILSAGRDGHLLRLRNEVLKSSGHLTISAHSVREIIEKFIQGDFDAVLLCHSFTEEEQELIANAIHLKRPSTPVLVLNDGQRSSRDGHFSVPFDPRSLLEAIETVTHDASIRWRDQV